MSLALVDAFGAAFVVEEHSRVIDAEEVHA